MIGFLNEFCFDLRRRVLPQFDQAGEWSDRQLALLIYGVLKYGEGDWKHILEGMDFDKSEISAFFKADEAPAAFSSFEAA